MRIISGIFKGYKIKGDPELSIRPTTDRVKESLFNILGSSIKGCYFLDLFSGYGNIGTEAISRGAQSVVFVDNNPKCIKAIKNNLSVLIARQGAVESCYEIIFQDVFSYLKEADNSKKNFDIIFLDPPYRTDLIEKCLLELSKYDILSHSGIIIAEIFSNKNIPFKIGRFRQIRQENYGKSKLLFYR